MKLVLLATAVLIAPMVAHATAYSIQSVYIAGSQDTYLTGINDSGQVVGFAEVNGADTGVVVTNGIVSTFNVPFAVDTRLGGINNNGQIAGQYVTPYPGTIFGFVDTAGTIASFRPPGIANPAFNGINDAGDIVGTDAGYSAFLYRSGVATIFGPSSVQTDIYAINDSGVTSGTVSPSLFKSDGFVYDRTGYHIVDYPGATYTSLGSVNDLGQIPGLAGFGRSVYGSPTSYMNFIYQNGSYTAFDAKSLPGGPIAINDSGVVIGDGYDQTIRVYYDATHYTQGAGIGYIATPIPVSTPEPAMLAVLGTAFAGLIIGRRRAA